MASQAQTEIVANAPPRRCSTPPGMPAKVVAARAKARLIRRTDRDYSQSLRHGLQAAFGLLNIWIGGVFYLWVRQFEPGGHATVLTRPPGVEGWLPIAGMMNLKYFVMTHQVPGLHPAAMFLLLTFVAIAFLFRKAFCSWLCPIGSVSEILWNLGKSLFRRNFYIVRWIDIPLRGLKYLLLGFFVWAVSSMTASDIDAFMRSPYGIIADVKMLNFFRFLGLTGGAVLGVFLLASIFVQNFWCRYLCPYGALLGLASTFSPMRIRRDASACIDCAKCTKACPSALPVDKLVTIKSAECTGCLECIAVCPAQGALRISLPEVGSGQGSLWRYPSPSSPRQSRPQGTQPWAIAVGMLALFLGIVGFAKTAGYWSSDVPRAVYERTVPNANEARHPMPGD